MKTNTSRGRANVGSNLKYSERVLEQQVSAKVKAITVIYRVEVSSISKKKEQYLLTCLWLVFKQVWDVKHQYRLQ